MSPHNPAGPRGPYAELCARLGEIGTLGSVAALLTWDQETGMPPKAAEFRADELALLARLIHERRTAPRLRELLEASEQDPAVAGDPLAAADVREIRRDVDRAVRLPVELVEDSAASAARAVEVWRSARARSDFEAFRPALEQLLELARRRAACLVEPRHGEPYDALLDVYEPEVGAADLDRMFAPLREGLPELIAQIRESGATVDDARFRAEVPVDRQLAFHRRVAAAVGYDFDAGRLDLSTHPFSEGVGPGDTRITTRFGAGGFLDALGSTLHETGHALYEQGLPKDRAHGRPIAEAAGLGVHESQSRLWENQVGRSREFWRWAAPVAHELLGAAVEPLDAEALYRGANVVRPGPIRVESDEATYNLHVLLRFDLERAMVRGDLAVRDLPAAWNERLARDLGVEVPDDRRGCLQDIHWASGAFGYFPTYTLGNVYAAQLWEAIRRDLPEVGDDIAAGRFAPLLAWLRASIHEHGRRYVGAELIRRATGASADARALLAYLRGKFAPLYGIA